MKLTLLSIICLRDQNAYERMEFIIDEGEINRFNGHIEVPLIVIHLSLNNSECKNIGLLEAFFQQLVIADAQLSSSQLPFKKFRYRNDLHKICCH